MKALHGLLNRMLQAVALYIPGATTTRVWLHRRRGVQIGDGTFISTAVILETERPDLISIGQRTSIGIRAVIVAHFWSQLGVEIGDDVFVGPGVIIMPNVKIGDGAVITAGSVVTKSVPELTMVRGNPAEPIARCGIHLGVDTPYEKFIRTLRPIRTPRNTAQ
jgi:acetyltransferase-like isoleucine patch superfamily enzyme